MDTCSVDRTVGQIIAFPAKQTSIFYESVGKAGGTFRRKVTPHLRDFQRRMKANVAKSPFVMWLLKFTC